MKTTQTNAETENFSTEKISSLVAQLLGAQPNPILNGPSPEPWGPYIRKVLRHGVFGPRPEPWQDYAFSQNFQSSYLLAALNPQPLPPRSALMIAVLQEVIDQVLLIHDVAFALNHRGQEQSIIIVSGSFGKYLDDFDGLCHLIEPYIPKLNGWNEPVPHPNEKFSAVELLTAAYMFKQSANTITDENMREELLQAHKRLTNMGLERM